MCCGSGTNINEADVLEYLMVCDFRLHLEVIPSRIPSKPHQFVLTSIYHSSLAKTTSCQTLVSIMAVTVQTPMVIPGLHAPPTIEAVLGSVSLSYLADTSSADLEIVTTSSPPTDISLLCQCFTFRSLQVSLRASGCRTSLGCTSFMDTSNLMKAASCSALPSRLFAGAGLNPPA